MKITYFLKKFDHKLALLQLSIISFYIFGLGLRYNGPFIDESFYSVAVKIGNVEYMGGEAYMWPLISYFAHSIGGLAAARFTTVLLTTLTATALYKITNIYSNNLFSNKYDSNPGFIAGIVYAISAPVMFTGTLAGYDSLALCLFSFGFLNIMKGCETISKFSLLLAAFLLAASAASRYFAFCYVPVGLAYAFIFGLRDNKAKHILIYFFAPFAVIFGAYFTVNHAHIISAISHTSNVVAGSFAARSVPDLFFMMLKYAPLHITIGSILFLILAIGFAGRKEKDRLLNAIFLAGAMSVATIYHLYRGTDLALLRDLSLTVFFASILIGCVISHSLSAHGRTAGLVALVAAILFFGTSYPVVLAERNSWQDTTPIIDEIRNLGLNNEKIWTTMQGCAWHLYAEFGTNVDVKSAWLNTDPQKTLELADKNNIQVLITLLPENAGENDILQGYIVKKSVVVDGKKAADILVKENNNGSK